MVKSSRWGTLRPAVVSAARIWSYVTSVKWFPLYLLIKDFYLNFSWDFTVPGQSGPRSYGNEGVLHILQRSSCPVSWGCRIHRLHLSRGVRRPNECPGYDTKQSDGEVPVMLEHWGMWSTPSLPSVPGPLWPGVGAPDRVLSMGQIKLNCILIINWIVWNRTILTSKLRTSAKLNCLK